MSTVIRLHKQEDNADVRVITLTERIDNSVKSNLNENLNIGGVDVTLACEGYAKLVRLEVRALEPLPSKSSAGAIVTISQLTVIPQTRSVPRDECQLTDAETKQIVRLALDILNEIRIEPPIIGWILDLHK